jgi:hypothetical protein
MNLKVEHGIIAILLIALLYYIVSHDSLLSDLSRVPDKGNPQLKAVKGKHTCHIYTCDPCGAGYVDDPIGDKGNCLRPIRADDANYVNGFNNAIPGHEIPNRDLGDGCYGNPSNKEYSELKTQYKKKADNRCHTNKDLVSCQGLDTLGGECEWFTARPDCACKNPKYKKDNEDRGNRRCDKYIEGDNNQPCAEKGANPRDNNNNVHYLNMRGNMHECFTDNECSKDRVCAGEDWNYIYKHTCVPK